ncbi:MAG TPA: translation initiation factor IF-2 [Puia sp.]|jgi:translation initiation factor IF-2|nr:translation initiation factor IF-2 [Puia sp.]
MAETTTPRLMAAAKEFNIGKETLVDFLVGKGFSKDDLKPTAKLTDDMYRSLQQEFQGDKVAKIKSNQIDLPKGSVEAKRKKEDETVLFRKDPKKIVKEEPLVVEEVKPLKIEEPKKEPEIIKIEAPHIEEPKIIDKIDLSQIDSSTRPKKTTKKKEPEEKPVVAEEIKPPVVSEQLEIISKNSEPEMEESEEATIENIFIDKIEGPRILGKIDLPLETEKPKQADEKRKRKRIPIEKREGGGGGKPSGNGIPIQRDPTRPSSGAKPILRRDLRSPASSTNRSTASPRDQKEIDKKEIQEKIRETQAKLAGTGGRGRGSKAKYRRARREENAELSGSEQQESSKLQVTEFISVSELANLIDVSYADIISKCMSLGMMVSINQRLEADVIELVAGEFGFTVEFIGIDDALELEEEEIVDGPEDLVPRSPVVTIMGHVDHGKTSLLDFIRVANVVAGEAGGITQHIGAYQVTTANGKKITFLDTPGHEAFTAMRARGAKAADIAIIVIAADDAIMPQTKEAISHAQAANLPMVFAINKIDKEGANPEKIKEQLAGMNILVEDWGGKYQSQEISAKKGQNVDLLLEKILLEAEILDLKSNPNREASGTVIEASLDKGRGYVATVLVQGGTLKSGDLVVSGQYFGRIKAMFNERNKKIEDAPPSSPVLLLGLNGAPQAGEKFKVFEDESEAKETANRRGQLAREQGIRTKKHITLDEIGRRLALGNFKELNLIIKGDVDGSVEALSDSLQKLSTEEIAVRVVHKAVGAITESDVLLATASDAVVVGFNVRASVQAARLAENEGVQIKTYSIIYNAIEEVKSAMEGMLEPKIQEKVVANVEIRNVFKFDKATVAGCYVLDGKIYRNSKIRLVRDGIVIYPVGEGATAELASLKRFKDDAKEVPSGMECGLVIKNYADYHVGDIVEAYEEEEVKRTL